jgi:cation diffusion facilitator CzcD-associated flavoprotein CzcO
MNTNMAAQVDVAVVGAGIVGLAAARELLRRRPRLRLAVLDKEASVGTSLAPWYVRPVRRTSPGVPQPPTSPATAVT